MTVSVLPLEPAAYRMHRLHWQDCAWVEKNCYVDVWIELLHALRMEPLAMLGFSLAVDFEGDQWTFFKPPHEALARLYGVQVVELNPWRGDILAHALDHLAEGKPVFTEADAYWLPDTRGTDYRSVHTKTTIVINALDVGGRRLGYFHGAGYHELCGDDFVHLFRVGYPADAAFLPLFAEFVRIDRATHRPEAQLREVAVELLRVQIGRAPRSNPFERFRRRLPHDAAWLVEERSLALYHRYAFAGLRQLGAAFEAAAQHLEWLSAGGEAGLERSQAAFLEISSLARTVMLKLARAVQSGRLPQLTPLLDALGGAWESGMAALIGRHG